LYRATAKSNVGPCLNELPAATILPSGWMARPVAPCALANSPMTPPPSKLVSRLPSGF
jgi:hypothetical protein